MARICCLAEVDRISFHLCMEGTGVCITGTYSPESQLCFSPCINGTEVLDSSFLKLSVKPKMTVMLCLTYALQMCLPYMLCIWCSPQPVYSTVAHFLFLM